MKRSYQGNARPFAAVLFPKEDASAVLPVLETLQKEGKSLCYGGKAAKKSVLRRASVVILFLTEHFGKKEGLIKAVLFARSLGIPLLPVDMPGGSCPEVLSPFLYARNHIDASKYPTAAELGQRIAEAEPLQTNRPSDAQRKARRRGITVIILLAFLAAGLALWIFLSDLIGQVQERLNPTPTPSPTPAPKVTVSGKKYWQITEEDLRKMTYASIIGDVLIETDNPFRYVDEVWDNGAIYYVWATDEYGYSPGERVSKGMTSDFSVLSYMTKLKYLCLIEQNCSALPSLENAKNLKDVEILNCSFSDLSCFTGCTGLLTLRLIGTDVSDLSPLNGCQPLAEIRIQDPESKLKSLQGFESPTLKRLYLDYTPGIRDYSPLAGCPALKELHLGVSGGNVAFLSSLTELEMLNLNDSDGRLRDLSPLSALTNLKNLYLDCSRAQSLDFLAFLTELRVLELNGNTGHADMSAFADNPKPKLNSLRIDSFNGPNFDFLKGVNVPLTMEVHIENRPNLSGLGLIEQYTRLNITFDDGGWNSGEALFKALSGVAVGTLDLNGVRLQNLKGLPERVGNLCLGNANLTSLEGIEAGNALVSLSLFECGRLTSLSGIEGCRILHNLSVSKCLRLKDTDAVYALNPLISLRWENMPSFPFDLSKIQASGNFRLELIGIPTLESLDFLADGGQDIFYQTLHLNHLPAVRNVDGLLKVRGQTLQFDSQLSGMITSLASAKWLRFDRLENVGQADNGSLIAIELEELGDLETLEPAQLALVSSFRLQGGTLLTGDLRAEAEWKNGKSTPLVEDPSTGDLTPAGKGFLKDLSSLASLTGLKELRLCYQPLTSVEGIQSFSSLVDISFNRCDKLADVSPVFALTSPESVDFDGTAIKSISGVQNLRNLYALSLSDTKVSDLSPLEGIDYSHAQEVGGFWLNVDGIPCKDYSPLSAIPSFSELFISMNSGRLYEWVPYVQNASIRQLTAQGTFTNETLAAFAADHPEVEELNVSWSNKLTDLTPLLSLENLRRVTVSSDMKKAIKSLGNTCPFELEVWN